MLDLEFLNIERLVVHHVPAAKDKQVAQPRIAAEKVQLAGGGIDMFNRRIATALGHKSHGIKVDFQEHGAGSFFQDAVNGMYAGEPEFIAHSASFAHRLCSAQGVRPYPACKLIVMSGKTGKFQRPFMAVVKADMQDALAERQADGRTTVDYLNNVFLTDSQRLYKIGFVQQMNAQPKPDGNLHNKDDYAVHLFDHLLTGTETRTAAHYFYGTFLGANIAASDKRLTQDFFTKTKQFLDSRGFSPVKRIELGESLRSELRSNTQTISVKDFADKYLDKGDQAEYAAFMARSAFPTHAITKDTEYILSKLKRRQKLAFTTGVMITTPADKITLVNVCDPVDGKTTVVIDGIVERQE
ncbi:nucleoid-associated protein [Achromobacter mucicolens]|uniref:nucleoid-associated protein n=1 Tax=Achromobacter mucicolens TaxID=1389922 RepID=UPI0021D06D4D|nr:nucleoid-associated protein [Achromobacter mucicolens]